MQATDAATPNGRTFSAFGPEDNYEDILRNLANELDTARRELQQRDRRQAGIARIQAARTKWNETPWKPGREIYEELAKRLPTECLLREVFERLSETDAALAFIIEDHDCINGRVEALESTSTDLVQRVHDLELLFEEVQADHRAMKEALLHRRRSSNGTSTSELTSTIAPDGAVNLVVMKHLTELQFQELQQVGCRAFLGLDCAEFGLQYVRGWRSKSGVGWSAVVEVGSGKRKEFTKKFSMARRELRLDVVVVPYLSSEVMELRKQRTAVFRSLVDQGLSPKWSGDADVWYVHNGVRVKYKF